MPQFASKAEEKNYYERQASLAEFLTWYHQQEYGSSLLQQGSRSIESLTDST